MKKNNPTQSLIGNSGIQFCDLKINLTADESTSRLKWNFAEVEIEDASVFGLVVHGPNGAPTMAGLGENQVIPEEKIYSVKADAALQLFEGHWLPIPYFRKGTYDPTIHPGPTTWARMWLNPITGSSKKSGADTHHLILAFDTTIQKNTASYLTPEPTDLNGSMFELATEASELADFLELEGWVDQWIEQVFCQAAPTAGIKKDHLKQDFGHIAYYLAFLSVLKQSQELPRIILHGQKESDEPKREIEVELILDIGNSRSCGVLMETSKSGQPFSFSNCRPLEIRDLSIPCNVYRDPFEMRCEFVKADLGVASASKLCGRGNAFVWPSLVRVGHEATRLAVINGNPNYKTGMSSPKRYLWDTERAEVAWMFNASHGEARIPPPALNDFSTLFAEDGTFIAAQKDKAPGMNPYYSRCSLMTFALSEILLHALIQINSPAFRKHHGEETVRRKLKRLVLTCPTAMLEHDKKTLRQSANEAVQALKRYFGDNLIDPQLEVLPNPDKTVPLADFVDWGYDEATCVQLAYMYGEIAERYRNDHRLFFEVNGKHLDREADGPRHLTVASIDIGGGTTDLMICNYTVDPSAHMTVLVPDPLFWEGFNLAGDDILKRVIERIVLPRIHAHARETGCQATADAVNFLFGADHASQSAHDRNMRAQFANQIALPMACAVIQHCADDLPIQTKGFDDFFQNTPMPQADLVDHINSVFARYGSTGFELRTLSWTLSTLEINDVIRQVMRDMIGSLCQVLHRFDCDLLLLAGRPSVLPVIREIFYQFLPMPPDRIIPLGQYPIGRWYPFSDQSGAVHDPKTCVCVGAAIGLIGGNLSRLNGFRLDSRRLGKKVRSTANFIGKMNEHKVTLDTVYLERGQEDCRFEFHGPMLLGMRQLCHQKWIATPMYKVTYESNQAARELRPYLPLQITIGRLDADEKPEDIIKHPIEIVDAHGNHHSSSRIQIRPQSLIEERGHWLDTGIFIVSHH